MTQQTPRAKNDAPEVEPHPNVTVLSNENETLLINGDTQALYHLDEIGARVWQLLSARISREQLLLTLLDELDVAREELESDVQDLVHDLQAQGLLREAASGLDTRPAVPPPDPEDAPALSPHREPTWLIQWDTRTEKCPSCWTAPGASLSRSRFLMQKSGSFFLAAGQPLTLAGLPEQASSLARRYERQGPELFRHLRGAFALVGWDAGRRCLVAGRDGLGLVPLYYWWQDGLLVLSPFLDAVLSRPEVRHQLDRTLVLEHLLGWYPAAQRDETFYRDVKRLPPAHVLRLDEDGLEVRRYWDPLPPGVEWATTAERQRLVPTLEQAVTRCLQAGADSIALSGGYDSVSIAALAAGLEGPKSPLQAISLRFAAAPLDEGPVQLRVARALGLRHHNATVEASLDGQSLVEACLSQGCLSPTPVLNLFQGLTLGLLRSASSRACRGLLTGTGGDELFDVDPIHAADCLAAGAWADLWRFVLSCHRSWPGSPGQIARDILWNNALRPRARELAKAALGSLFEPLGPWATRRRSTGRLPPWLGPAATSLLPRIFERRSSPRTPSAPEDSRYLRTLRSLPQSILLMVELEQAFAWTHQAGVTLLYPFFDPDVVELALRTPPQHLLGGGWAKAPLRSLVAQRIPAMTARAKKVDFSASFNAFLRPEALTCWRRLGGAQMLSQLGLVDAVRAGERMQLAGQPGAGPDLAAWTLLSTESWLQQRASRPTWVLRRLERSSWPTSARP